MSLETVEIHPRWLRFSMEDSFKFYADRCRMARERGGEAGERSMSRHLAENDLFYFLVFVLHRGDMVHPWVYKRCREYQRNPFGHLDLWAREHYKSTIITFGAPLWLIVKNPNVSIGIFSHTRPIAKAFLVQIKREMELNDDLKALWPHIFYSDPASKADKWSEDEGIIVRRTANMKESTVEAWGLVDGQPTSKHFLHRIYDDVVVPASVSTPEQMKKTMSAFELSDNLGAQGGTFAMAGTRYHQFDAYYEMMKRGSVKVRIHPCTKDGTIKGEPVLMSREELDVKYKVQGLYTFSTQMLLNPVADKAMGFKEEWLDYHEVADSKSLTVFNRALLVDPANSKVSNKSARGRKDPDYTSMWVFGWGPDHKYYLLDGVRDRLNLTERSKALFRLHRKWRPQKTGIEEYGLNSDIQFYEYQMKNEETYHFSITALGGNQLSKNDRILKLIPVFENKRMFLPRQLLYKTLDGQTIDLVQVFREEEYLTFPVMKHDDMLDNMARILDEDLEMQWPDPDFNTNNAPGIDYSGPIDGNPAEEIDWMLL